MQSAKWGRGERHEKQGSAKEGETLLGGGGETQSQKNFFSVSTYILSHIQSWVILKTTCILLMENWRNVVIVPLKTTFLRENFFSTFRIIYSGFVKDTKQIAHRKPTHPGCVLCEHLDSRNCLCSWEGEYIAQREAQKSKLSLPWWWQGEKLLQSRACSANKVVWEKNKMILKHV